MDVCNAFYQLELILSFYDKGIIISLCLIEYFCIELGQCVENIL